MQEVGVVQNKKSRTRVRISVVMCAAAVLMLVVIRGSFAAPDDKITLCHGTNSVNNPYVTITVDQSAVDGGGNDDHSHHTGPVATSEEVAQQLKDDKVAWGDIIPPFGEYPGLNWEEGQAIWENDCSYAVASDDGADDSADAQDDSSDSQDDSADEQDDSSDSQDDSADEQDDSSDSQDDSTDAVDDSTDDGSDVLADDSVADDDGSTPSDDGSEVQGRTITKPLAQTGSETTILAMIGFAMLLAGSAMRFGRFGRTVYATVSYSPADLLAKKLEARSRHWTCRK